MVHLLFFISETKTKFLLMFIDKLKTQSWQSYSQKTVLFCKLYMLICSSCSAFDLLEIQHSKQISYLVYLPIKDAKIPREIRSFAETYEL